MNKTVRYSAMIIGLFLLIGACSGNRTAENSVGAMSGTEGKPADSVNDRSEKLVFWGGRYHEAKPQIPQQGTILKALKVTTRISSNHYSDFALDEEGNAYIACFSKKQDNADYIYIAKISRSGEVIWAVQDITVDAEGNILATATMRPIPKLNRVQQVAMDLHFFLFSPEGAQLRNRTILHGNETNTVAKSAIDVQGNVWLATKVIRKFKLGNTHYTAEQDQQSILAKFDKHWDLDTLIQIHSGPNMMFRASETYWDGVVLTGHYKEWLEIGEAEVRSGTNNTLFYLNYHPSPQE